MPRVKLDVDEIIKLYLSGESANAIARRFKSTPPTILSRLRENNIKIRTLSEQYANPINSRVFDEITENSAYWIGFLMADGNVYKNRIQVGLHIKDIEHVRAFADFIGSTNKIHERKNRPMCNFKVNNDYMVRKLEEYNIVPRKSLTASPPTCLKSNRHFWRGMIDGDGNIRNPERGTAGIRLYGSYDCCHGFASFCSQVLDYPINVHPEKSIYVAYISGVVKTREICKCLYSDCETSLPRKQARADGWMKRQ